MIFSATKAGLQIKIEDMSMDTLLDYVDYYTKTLKGGKESDAVGIADLPNTI